MEVDKREKSRRIARDAITALLVYLEQPKTKEEYWKLLDEWEEVSYEKLIEAKEYNLNKSPWANQALVRHADLCLKRTKLSRGSQP